MYRVAAFAFALWASSAGAFGAGSDSGAVSLYGIAIGQPLGFPPCVVEKVGDMTVYADGRNDEQTCQMRSWMPAGRVVEGSWMEVHFPAGHRPLAKDGEISVWLDGGTVQDITIVTPGIDVQDELLAQLTSKFGKPTRVQVEAVQNSFGAKFAVKHARWIVSNTSIQFDGAVDTLVDSQLEVQSPAGAVMRAREAARIQMRSPAL